MKDFPSRRISAIAKLMKLLPICLALAAFVYNASAADEQWITYQGKSGHGVGKHIVLISGDEEYRSEEALPQLAKILTQRHGFKCTVLFSMNPQTGEIDPNNAKNEPGLEALATADLCIIALRFRTWPDDQMKHFADYVAAGKPIIGLRTSTHAFKDLKGTYASLNDFGKKVLGEQWVSHWGSHKKEATRGIIEPGAKDDPILRGVADIFGDTDVYEAHPPADAKVLMRGQVLKGMKPTDPPAKYTKKTNKGREQDVNDPMMPVVWTRLYKNEAGKENKVLCTTLGSATDLQNEGLRRLVVNSVYWGLGMDVPAKADVGYVGEYKPTDYGFK